MKTTLRLIFFGPPGVGKGTQAKLLAHEFNIPHISTGDMLRSAVTEGTALGKKAKTIMEAGQLVPDDIMIGIVREVLTSPKVKDGFILDGFPRTLQQAIALSDLFNELHITDYSVVNFEANDAEIIRRLGSRVMCVNDGKIYNTLTDGVTLNSPCPACGGRLIQRDDDAEETVRKRLEVYHSTTKPVLDFYRSRGVVFEVDGMASIEAVNQSIKKILCT